MRRKPSHRSSLGATGTPGHPGGQRRGTEKAPRHPAGRRPQRCFATGRSPRIAHVGTASGDQRWFNNEVSEAGNAAGFRLMHLNLFSMPNVANIAEYLLGQDVVRVNGGSVVNLLAWRAHELNAIFRRVWEAGVVLAGVSAGSICWFNGGTTGSFGPELRAVRNGLGLLPFDNGVHYDSKAWLKRSPKNPAGPPAGSAWTRPAAQTPE